MWHIRIVKGKIELIEDKIIEIKIERADIVKKIVWQYDAPEHHLTSWQFCFVQECS